MGTTSKMRKRNKISETDLNFVNIIMLTYNSDAVSNSIAGQIFSKSSADAAVVSVQSCNLSPDSAYSALMLGVCWG